MHVFAEEPNTKRSRQRAQVAQCAVAAPLICTGLLSVTAVPSDAGIHHVVTAYMQLAMGVLTLVACVVSFYFQYQRGWGQFRVVLTADTLAIKLPHKPIRFIRRDDCVAYGPQKRQLLLRDGSEHALVEIGASVETLDGITDALFAQWWSLDELSRMEEALDAALPEPSSAWTRNLLFLAAVFSVIYLGKALFYGQGRSSLWFVPFCILVLTLAQIAWQLVLDRPTRLRLREREAFRVPLAAEAG